MLGIDGRFKDEEPEVGAGIFADKPTVVQESSIGRTVIIGAGHIPFSEVRSAFEMADATDPAAAALMREVQQFQTSSRAPIAGETAQAGIEDTVPVRPTETVVTSDVL